VIVLGEAHLRRILQAYARYYNDLRTRLVAYLIRYMTPIAQATRPIGDLITISAAWFHSLIGIAADLILVLAAWSYGLLPLRRA
jgi:hypothetical protein